MNVTKKVLSVALGIAVVIIAILSILLHKATMTNDLIPPMEIEIDVLDTAKIDSLLLVIETKNLTNDSLLNKIKSVKENVKIIKVQSNYEKNKYNSVIISNDVSTDQLFDSITKPFFKPDSLKQE